MGPGFVKGDLVTPQVAPLCGPWGPAQGVSQDGPSPLYFGSASRVWLGWGLVCQADSVPGSHVCCPTEDLPPHPVGARVVWHAGRSAGEPGSQREAAVLVAGGAGSVPAVGTRKPFLWGADLGLEEEQASCGV